MRSMDQVAVQPFVAVARAKGMSETGVLWRHVMGNALLPALNIAGLLLGELIAGALITETVFGRSGLGQLTQQAVNNRDIAVLQAVVMISALGFVLINLLVDWSCRDWIPDSIYRPEVRNEHGRLYHRGSPPPGVA